jgi:DNA-binding Lrp family transcriptional regulator
MSIKAYILANVEAGMGEEVVEVLSVIEGVKSAHNVTGPYDVIAFVEVPDTAVLGDLVINGIQLMEGVDYTLTCVVM